MLALPDDFAHANVGCCGVLAVAIMADVPFQRAWDTLKPMQKRPGAWKGKTYHHHRIAALAILGHSAETATPTRRRTLTTVVKSLEPGRTYMVRVRGHVVTVRNGIVVDQSGAHPIDRKSTLLNSSH